MTPIEKAKQLWTELDRADREKFVDWSSGLCPTCGREGTWDGKRHGNGIYCDECCAEQHPPDLGVIGDDDE
jgi:hypothetical protein